MSRQGTPIIFGGTVYLNRWERDKLAEFCRNILDDGYEGDPDGNKRYKQLLNKLEGYYTTPSAARWWRKKIKERHGDAQKKLKKALR